MRTPKGLRHGSRGAKLGAMQNQHPVRRLGGASLAIAALAVVSSTVGCAAAPSSENTASSSAAQTAFPSPWLFQGTIDYLGGSGTIDWPIAEQPATDVLLEAPVTCAPHVSLAESVLFPNGERFPLLFEGQTLEDGFLRAQYRVGGGVPAAVLTGVELTIVGPLGDRCFINVYTQSVIL
jgi:hypothetical protein